MGMESLSHDILIFKRKSERELQVFNLDSYWNSVGIEMAKLYVVYRVMGKYMCCYYRGS